MAGLVVSQHEDGVPNEITKNLVYLTKHITNLDEILIHLIEHSIISENERQVIMNSENTDLQKNSNLLFLIQKKGWPAMQKVFLQILRTTANDNCASIIEGIPVTAPEFKRKSALPSKWWPEEKKLPNAFFERNVGDCLLTVKLKEMLNQDKCEGMAVITQQLTVSGLGGIGKTTTAIWFARQYEKDYENIIWIDCGEKSLLISLNNLARGLELKNRLELQHDAKQIADGCFKIMSNWKCLFIFDNAECYIGNEGVKDVLPKSIKNFDVLITSRNKDWGHTNGYGKIPQFEMNVFEKSEGIEFLKRNITDVTKKIDSHIETLCDLLGNLPLALQIAVAALNGQDALNIQNYILRVENTPELLHSTFDDYEKTIDKTMKISLDLIRIVGTDYELKVSNLAYKILTIFGYITPDDVPSEFFISVEMKRPTLFTKIAGTFFNAEADSIEGFNEHDIVAATGLLERYSLINRRKCSENKYTLSTHRLLQQVIRHNSKESKGKILDQILNSKGFLDYKLIPFSFADHKLQKKFPKIKAKLMDRLKLNVLLQERRFKEAVELARIIKNALKDDVSIYNFAVCLRHNLEFIESEKILKGLLHKTIGNEQRSKLTESFAHWGTIDSFSNITKEDAMRQLFLIYLHQKNSVQAKQIILELERLNIPILPLSEVLTFLSLMSLGNVFLGLRETEKHITLEVYQINTQKTKLKLECWVLNSRTRIPSDWDECELVNCKLLANNHDMIMAPIVILRNVEFSHNSFLENPQQKLITISDFFNVEKVKKLLLKPIKFDSYRRVHAITLSSNNNFEWGQSDWILDAKSVQFVDFLKNPFLAITKITLAQTSVDFAILPPTLKKLSLKECSLINYFESPSDAVNSRFICLQELYLLYIILKGSTGLQCRDISNLIPPNLKILEVTNFGCECYTLKIKLEVLTSIESLILANCSLIIVPSVLISPTQLTLKKVCLFNDKADTTIDICLNQFVDFKNLRQLNINEMSIDFSEYVNVSEITLINAKLVNWEQGRWHLDKLRIFPDQNQTQMKIDEIEILTEPMTEGSNSSTEVNKYQLMSFLKSTSDTKAIMGVYSDNNQQDYITTIQSVAGAFPRICTTRAPKYSTEVDEWQTFIENTISDWNRHYLVHIIWHPVELNAILEDEDGGTSWIDLIGDSGTRNQFWKKNLDAIAPFLHQLQAAGVVPIVDFLPFINYNSMFYLWGGRGGLKGSLKLLQITKDYLTQHHGLTSPIWAWSLYVYGDLQRLEEYWPGNKYIDVVTVHMWGRDRLSSTEYQKLLSVVGDKPIAMEGMDYVASTQLLKIQSKWAWFTIYHDVLATRNQNTECERNPSNSFNNPFVINRSNNQFLSETFGS